MIFLNPPKLLLVIGLCQIILGGCRSAAEDKQQFLTRGDAYLAAGKLREACLAYRQAIHGDGNFAEAHYKLAKCELKLRDTTAAYREMLRTVELQPTNWAAQTDLAELLLVGGKPKEAKERALLILQSNSSHAEAQIILSNADNLLGNYREALEEARAAVSMAPDRSDPYVNMALIEMKSAAEDAETQLHKAASLDPTSITPAMALATLYWTQQRWADSERQFQAAIALAPKNPTPRAAMANLYLSHGQEARAESLLAETKRDLPDDPAAYKLLGYFYLARGENAKALTEFESLCAEHPRDLDSRRERVQLLILSHRVEDAKELNNEILKESPHDADALVLSAQIDMQLKRYDDAIRSLQQAVTSATVGSSAHYYLGLVYQQRSEVQRAEGEWEKAVQLQPGLVQAWEALATLAVQSGNWSRLETISVRIKALAPRAVDGYLFHAVARFNRGDDGAAEADYKILIDLVPNSGLGYAKLGELRMHQNRLSDADVLFHQALHREPRSIEALQGSVELDFRRGQPDKALQLVQTHLASDPNNFGLCLLFAKAQLSDHKPSDAEQSARRCLELQGDNLVALTLLAQAQASNRHIDSAILSYQKAIERAPNDAALYVALGSLYESQDNWKRAEAVYQKALEVDASNGVAANNLAFGMLEHGEDKNVALTLAETARRALPGQPSVADTLGWAYYQIGAFRTAAMLLEEATRGASNNQTYRYHLALTYRQMKDCGRFRQQVNKIISIDPDSHISDQARRAGVEGCAK
jgi:tetratricopeptide (TPR) repeat protein